MELIFIILLALLLIVATTFAICACALSARISRMEENQF